MHEMATNPEPAAHGSSAATTTADPKPHPLALSQCTVHGQKGSSYTVTCNICGLGGEKGLTTSVHKLMYGHYLHQSGNDIRPCIARALLRSQHPEWFELLLSREASLLKKRK